MTRRAVRRRYAILGVLHEIGPVTGEQLEKALRRGAGSLYADLSLLEQAGRIVGEFEERCDGRPARRYYRAAGAGVGSVPGQRRGGAG